MAIYHLTVKTLGRTKNHKAVAAAAYRSGSKLRDERYDVTHDYTRRKGVVHEEIIAPADSPAWVRDREMLWNAVERSEKRKDSQVAREIEVALPRELSSGEQRELLRRFVGEEVVARGMVADCAIHERPATDGGTNPHAHLLLTMRTLTPDGLGPKAREWNNTELVETWRERWAVCCNEALVSAGIDAQIDPRTLEAQGIMREPTIHIGKDSFHADQKGRETPRTERQPSMVERSISPYVQQIEEEGQVSMNMTPEEGQNWWEKTVAFSRRVTERVQDWYERARNSWRGWVEGEDRGESDEGHSRIR